MQYSCFKMDDLGQSKEKNKKNPTTNQPHENTNHPIEPSCNGRSNGISFDLNGCRYDDRRSMHFPCPKMDNLGQLQKENKHIPTTNQPYDALEQPIEPSCNGRFNSTCFDFNGRREDDRRRKDLHTKRCQQQADLTRG
jgi:hypothetical protein